MWWLLRSRHHVRHVRRNRRRSPPRSLARPTCLQLSLAPTPPLQIPRLPFPALRPLPLWRAPPPWVFFPTFRIPAHRRFHRHLHCPGGLSGSDKLPNVIVTITATSNSDKTKTGKFSLTFDSGIRITLVPSTATLGTGAQQLFIAEDFNGNVLNDISPNPLTWGVTFESTAKTAAPIAAREATVAA